MPLPMCTELPVKQSAQPTDGLEYEVANGNAVRNEGERHCWRMPIGAARPKNITFQVADVYKPLLSITRAADAGYECHLSSKGGFLLSDRKREIRPPSLGKGDLYVLKAWVKENNRVQDCPRQA